MWKGGRWEGEGWEERGTRNEEKGGIRKKEEGRRKEITEIRIRIPYP